MQRQIKKKNLYKTNKFNNVKGNFVTKIAKGGISEEDFGCMLCLRAFFFFLVWNLHVQKIKRKNTNQNA